MQTDGTNTSTANPLVLIVEDDFSTRMLYREYLQHDGFRTIDAHNGYQALEKARDLRPNAVLTDLAVPGMDGFEFCRALRESPATRSIPILVFTGHRDIREQHIGSPLRQDPNRV